MRKQIFILIIGIALTFNALAQEQSFPHFRIAGLIGHTIVPTNVSEKEHTIVPSWGLDIEYWRNEHFAMGLHNDIEIQSFIIEHGNDESLEREFPLVLTLDAIYKMSNGFVFQIGPGYEIEKNESFFLIRAGIEYEIEFGKDWDLSPAIFYDTRVHANDTWTIALGIGKRF
ncbi:MAG: hypothetical protein IPJ74_25695 [Saprospiraceae bacterium]|nr:hypothetical protein [Saprospiraceae bacterium]